MLIYGTSSVKLKEIYQVNTPCKSCNHNIMLLHGIQPYGHIWFLPLLPKDKHFYLSCPECGTFLENSNPEGFQINIQEADFKTPITSYLGWFIVIAIFLFSFIKELM